MPSKTTPPAPGKKSPPPARPVAKAATAAPSTKPSAPEESSIPGNQKGSVYMEKGLTKNLGNYESVRVTIGMTLPIDHTPADIAGAKKTITVLNETIDEEMENQMAQIDTEGK